MTGLFDDPSGFFLRLLLQIPALLLAVTVHELAHGVVADRLGDPTARLNGRLTLNPLPHIDPLGAIAFVVAGFGWAKPVPVNAFNLKHPMRDMALVALAGPVSNFVVALAVLIGLAWLSPVTVLPFILLPLKGVLWFVYVFNLGLGIFNLIPLPPLDGGHFLPYFIPKAKWSTLHKLEQYGPLILLLAVMTGATAYIMGPAMRVVDSLFRSLTRLFV
jgi:Zn-dependent protease